MQEGSWNGDACPRCGNAMQREDRYCHHCGAERHHATSSRPMAVKSATAAVLLSIMLPGLGHLYAEDRNTGIMLIAATVVLAVLGVLLLVPLLVLLVIWLWGMLDAARATERFHARG